MLLCLICLGCHLAELNEDGGNEKSFECAEIDVPVFLFLNSKMLCCQHIIVVGVNLNLLKC